MLYVGDKQAVLYKGDYHPAELYKGGKKIAGYDTKTYSGDAEVEDTYNDFADVTVLGKAKQVQTVQGKNLCPTDWSKWTLSGGAYIDSEGYCVIGSTTALASVSFNFAKKANVSDLYISLVSEKLPDSQSDKNGWFGNYLYYLNDEFCGGNGMAEWLGDRPTRRISGSDAKKDCNIVKLKIGFDESYTPFYRFKEVSVTDYQYDLPASWFEPFVPNSPSPDYPSPIELSSGTVRTEGRNLFNKSATPVEIGAGARVPNRYSETEFGVITYQNLYCNSTSFSFPVDVIPNTDYIISGQAEGVILDDTVTKVTLDVKIDSYDTLIKDSYINSGDFAISFNSGENKTVYVKFYVIYPTVSYALAYGEFKNIQVQLGSIATPYEPYHPPTSLTTQQLFSMDGVYDTFENRVLVDGVWRSRHTQRWGKTVLDGITKGYKISYVGDVSISGVTRKVLVASGSCVSISFSLALSTHFLVRSAEQPLTTESNTFYIIGGRDLYLYASGDPYQYLVQANEWLATQHAAGTPVTFYYQLAEPIATLGDPQPLSTYPHYTKLSVQGDYPPDVTAQIKTIRR